MRDRSAERARWPRVMYLLAWALVLACFAGFTYIGLFVTPQSDTDFSIYLAAANALRHNPHAPIYSISTISNTYTTLGGCHPPARWGYIYQPLLALALEPFTYLPCSVANYLWQALCVAAWLGSVIWLSWDTYRRAGKGRALAVAFLMVCYLPVLNGFYEGQIHTLLLALFIASFALVERGYLKTAGALLAFGVFLKYLPIVMIGYYVVRGQWRVGLGALMGGLALGLVELLAVGPQLVGQSFLAIASGLGVANASTVATLLPFTGVAGKVAGALFVAGTLFIAWRLGRGARAPWDLERLGAAWALTTMLVVSPLIWWHYLTWLLPVFATLVVTLDSQWWSRRARAITAGLAAAAFLIAQVPYLPGDYLLCFLLWGVLGALALTRVMSLAEGDVAAPPSARLQPAEGPAAARS